MVSLQGICFFHLTYGWFCNLYIVKLAFAGSGVPGSSSCETFTTSSCRKETQEKMHPHIIYIYICIKPNKLFFWLISLFLLFFWLNRFLFGFSLFFRFFSLFFLFFFRFWFLFFFFFLFFWGWGWCSTAVGDLETSGQPEIWPLQLMCFRNYESRTFRIFSACSTAGLQVADCCRTRRKVRLSQFRKHISCSGHISGRPLVSKSPTAVEHAEKIRKVRLS